MSSLHLREDFGKTAVVKVLENYQESVVNSVHFKQIRTRR